MSDERLVRQWCDLLGWKYGPPWETPGRTGVALCEDGSVHVVLNEPDTFEGNAYTVDLPTLATCALVRHAGPVDVGSCQECEGRIDVRLAAHDFWADIIGSREQITPMAMERWRSGLREVVHEHTGMWRDVGIRQSLEDSTRCEVTGLDDLMAPCSCDVDGKPTGRRIVLAPEAVLLAPPRGVTGFGFGVTDDDALNEARLSAGYVEGQAVQERYTFGESREREDGRDRHAALTAVVRGHEGAREALRALAEGLEDLSAEAGRSGPVAADLGLSRGDELAVLLAFARPPDQPAYLHPCPDLGAWVLAWLDAYHSPTHFGERWRGARGPLYAHLTAAWERETVECGCWPSALTGERRRWPDRGQLRKSSRSTQSVPCERCAGLGRVRPEAQQEAACA